MSALALRVLLLAVRRAGGDAAKLIERLAIAPGVLDDVEGRVTVEVAFRAFELAQELVSDEAFCLHVVDAIPMGTFDVLDFSIRSAPTMGEALARATRYYRVIDDQSTLSLEVDGDVARLAGRRDPAAPRPATELLFAILIARGREYTGREWPLTEVSFVHESPRDLRAHEAFFGVAVRHDRPRNELVFARSWLDVPCRTSDAAMSSFLERHVSALLDAVPETPLDEVRRVVARALRGTAPTLESTARELGIGARTLQRRLRDLGTTFQALLASVRRELAGELLADERRSVSEVAYLLGFSEASAFHHAFVRWTGLSPTEYRAKHKR